MGKRRRTIVNYRQGSDDDQVAQPNRDGDEDEDGEWGRPLMKLRPRSARVTRKQETFRFFDLPAEIRNLIYEECFDQRDGPYFIGEVVLRLGRKQASVNGLTQRGRSPRQPIRVHRSINIALLRSNKAIRAEAEPLLYRHPYEFLSAATLQLFLLRLTAATISHLQHVDLECSRGMVTIRCHPTTFALLSPAVNLCTLRVANIAGLHHGRVGFDRKLGPVRWDADMAVADWDVLVGRNMAKEAYAQMFPFLASFLRSPERSKRGQAAGSPVSQLLSTLRIFETALLDGPKPMERSGTHRNCVWFGFGCAVMPSLAVGSAPWTPARREAMRVAMGEEIERLVEMD